VNDLIDSNETHRSQPAPPLISLRLGCTILVLAGLLVLAHGCHGDEDNELWGLVRGACTSSQP
jgi:hypothetical protein